MPNDKRNEAERQAPPNPSDRDRKRTPSDDADKSGRALGKQSTKESDKGAVSDAGTRRKDGAGTSQGRV